MYCCQASLASTGFHSGCEEFFCTFVFHPFDLRTLAPFKAYCHCVRVGKEKPPKFIAGIMVSRKNSTFLRLVYESYRNNYRGGDWDYNCARVPYQLYLEHPNLLHVEPYKFTTPDWMERYNLWNRVVDWKDLYVVHIMAHTDGVREKFTPESIKTNDSTFGEVMRYIYYGSPKLIRPNS